jgi:hypothetical protein
VRVLEAAVEHAILVVPNCAADEAVKLTVWDPATPAITGVTPTGALQPVIVSLGMGEAIVTAGAFGRTLMAPSDITELASTEGTPYT